MLTSVIAAAPAFADCQPDPASTGQTVTCSGTDNNGFQAGAAGQLTVNVLTGAAVNNLPLGSTAINLNDDNVVNNSGAIRAGDDGTGISAGNRNTITNASTGTITIGDSASFGAAGIAVQDDNVVTNLGTIRVGSTLGGGFPAAGIFVRDNNIAVTNAGAIIGGNLAAGIFAGNGNSINNRGSITLGQDSVGIFAQDGNMITNAAGATITVGDATPFGFGAFGIKVQDNNTIINLGTIAVGTSCGCFSPTGIDAGFGNTIVNGGTIVGGNYATGINVRDNNTVVNAAGATITAGIFGVGIATGDNNGITNNGSINVGPNGAGVLLGSTNTFINNGTVLAGAGGAGIASCGSCTQDNVVINNGTVDGRIDLEGTNHSFTNNGLITITDPGTPVGAAHFIEGSFSQGATGTLALRVNSAGVSDTLSATPLGTLNATLGGTLRAVVQPGLYGSSTFYAGVLVATDPITTIFGQTTTSSAFFTATATYNPNSVDLTLNRLPFGSVPGETQNQRNVGNYLEQNYSTGLTGNAATFFTNLLQSNSLGVLDKLSGEGTTGAQQTAFNAGNMFNKTMLDQVLSFLDGGGLGANDINPESTLLQYAASEKSKRPEYKAFAAIRPDSRAFQPRQLRAWMTAFGGTQSLQGDAVIGSANASNRTFGVAGGLDYQVNPDLLVGFAAAGSSSTFSVPGRATSGTLDAAHLGLYGVYRRGVAYLAGTLSYSHFDNDTTRTISGVGPTETALGRFGSDQFGGRLQAGRKFAFDRVAVTPFAAVQYLQLWQRAYTEASITTAGTPGILGLGFQSRAISSLPTFLGAQLDTRIAFAHGETFVPFVRASWVHEFMPDRSVAAAMSMLPTGTFIVDGPRAASDAARIEAGGNLYVTKNVAFFGNFVGEYSNSTSSNAGNGGLRVMW